MARVLVIDDVDYLRELLVIALEEAGHQVSEAREGREAMRLLREQPADLVFCDLFMEGQEGIETIRQLRRERQREGGRHERQPRRATHAALPLAARSGRRAAEALPPG